MMQGPSTFGGQHVSGPPLQCKHVQCNIYASYAMQRIPPVGEVTLPHLKQLIKVMTWDQGNTKALGQQGQRLGQLTAAGQLAKMSHSTSQPRCD